MASILIVDDSGLARRTTRQILERASHQVVEAEDGLSAIERYFLEKPDVVVLDVTMRGMDGIEVLTKLKELDAHAAIIIVTADVQSSTRQMAADAGASGFVIKPVKAELLLDAVKIALDRGASCN